MSKPLAIDLFCGLGGWTEGLLAEGYHVIGFDVERHRYPRVSSESGPVKRPGLNWSDRTKRGSKDAQFNRPPEIEAGAGWMEYPAQLVLQDVLTIHGKQFKDAALIVASPPCQEYSYMAMPWSLAKRKAEEYRSGERDVKELTALFDACFRIQREAIEAAGRHIPLVVENVRGACPWVGRSRWNYGSFHLWGDVPALMPIATARKNNGGSWFNIGSPGQKETGRNPVHELAGQKHLDADGYERTHPDAFGWKSPRTSSGAKSARKAASAAIAKIPLPLSRHIAAVWRPAA